MKSRLESASSQKLRKISIESIESSFCNHEDSIEKEHSSIASEEPEMENLISIIKLTLSSRNIPMCNDPDPLENLKHYTSVICSEYLKATQNVRDIHLNQDERKGSQEIPIVISDNSSNEILRRVFEMPDDGIVLSSSDCQSLSQLIVGVVRDSACEQLSLQVTELQRKIIKSAKELQELKSISKQKDFEAELLIQEIKNVKKAKKRDNIFEKNDCENLLNLEEE